MCPIGIRTRNVTCVDGNICGNTSKPHTYETCSDLDCEGDLIGENETQGWMEENAMNLFNGSEYVERQVFRRSLGEDDLKYMESDNTTSLGESFNVTEPESMSMNEYEWQVGSFGPCTRNCEGGYRSRKVVCQSMSTYDQVPEEECSGDLKPSSLEMCNTQSCLAWNVTKWSECSMPCGGGVTTREAFCPVTGKCDLDAFPITTDQCNSKPCLEWIAEEWSQCTHSCGLGLKTRRGMILTKSCLTSMSLLQIK